MYPFKPQIMIIRFLGITPTSSAVHTTLISICQQLCYNLEVPIEEIPTDFVPLKNYFKSLLDLASKTMFTVILLGKLIFHTFIFGTYGIYIGLSPPTKYIIRSFVFVPLKGRPNTLIRLLLVISKRLEDNNFRSYFQHCDNDETCFWDPNVLLRSEVGCYFSHSNTAY